MKGEKAVLVAGGKFFLGSLASRVWILAHWLFSPVPLGLPPVLVFGKEVIGCKQPERENERNNQKAKLVVSPAGITCWETGIKTKEY